MTIIVPPELENSINAAVRSGHFASLDAAMTEAARLLLRQLEQQRPAPTSTPAHDSGLGLIGALRDDADLLDQALEPQPARKPIWEEIDEIAAGYTGRRASEAAGRWCGPA